MTAGGIYLFLCCDWCAIEAEPGVTHLNRNEALAARTRVIRYEGWLLRHPKGQDAVLLCPECVADGR